MPTLKLAVAWAVPVKPDTLGGHLQAYIETLPCIETLRLCHSFGRGVKAAVTKLPVELRTEIESYIIDEARRRILPEWSRKFRCYQDICTAADHEQFDEHQRWPDGWCRRRQWDGHLKGYLAVHGTLFRQHFGLTIWVPETQRNRGLFESDEAMEKPTTTAYLTLPGYRTLSRSYPLPRKYGDRWQSLPDSGYGLPLEIKATPTEASLGRFAKAMKILDLVQFEGHVTSKTPLGESLAGDGDDVGSVAMEEDVSHAIADKESRSGAEGLGDVRAVRPRRTLLVVMGDYCC